MKNGPKKKNSGNVICVLYIIYILLQNYIFCLPKYILIILFLCVLGVKQNDILLSNTIQGLFFASPPMAVLSSSNELCKNHSQIYLRELEKLTIWALRSKWNCFYNKNGLSDEKYFN